MLAVVGGNAKPSAADVKTILDSVGASLEADESKSLESLVEEMSSKDINEVLEAGLAKLATVTMGGGGGGGGGGGAASGGDAAAAAPPEEESEEEEEMAPAANLFGGDDDDY